MAITSMLLREIEMKKKKIVSDPDAFLRLRKKIDNGLSHYCNVHSYYIEHPEERRDLLRSQNAQDFSDLKKKTNKRIGRINGAWEHLSLNFPDGLIGNLVPRTILDVGRMVDPDTHGFRDEGITFLKDIHYVPPSSRKVYGLVEGLCRDINESDYHPVEAAALVHLSLAGIQPLRDGNKRTARLLQDKILFDYELPPAFTPYGERDIYLDVLSQALEGKYSQSPPHLKSQRPFFDYIGGKVNTLLDEVIGDLS